MKRLIAISLASLVLAAFGPNPQDTAGSQALGIAERRQLGSQVVSAIVDQLTSNGCWTDHSDMPEARRLHATFRIQFGYDGRFSTPPQLVSPERDPTNDKPMQDFIQHARRALKVCDAIGWKLPERAFEILEGEYIDLQFLPRIG